MAPIETSLLYLTVASKGSPNEFGSTYGSSSYDWNDFYEFNAKVAYAKSKIAAVRDSAVSTGDETLATDENNQAGEATAQEATSFSIWNK